MSTASPDDPLGYDVFLREDIEEDGREGTGLELVQNAILHRLTQDKLILTDAPSGEDFVDFGEDVRNWVGAVDTQDSAQGKSQRLVEVLKREPNLAPSSIAVDVQLQARGAQWDFIITITARTTTEIPVALTVGVDAVTVQLLALGR